MSQPDTTSRSIAVTAIQRVADELEIAHLRDVDGNFDIFDSVDSFAIVELLMATEARLEEITGSYVPLADEKIFDAEQTPLHSLDRWVAYIDQQRADA